MDNSTKHKRIINVDNYIEYLSDVLSENDIEIMLVGGYVRNSLLYLETTDYDITSKAEPFQIKDVLKDRSEFQVIDKAINFGTIQINLFLNEKCYEFEHTTFRCDFYDDNGNHRPSHVKFTDDIKIDASRRDFTINAIYYNIKQDKLIDPLGGLKDLDNMVIKAARDDARLTLKDDGLRILRMIRFAAQLNFKVDPQLFMAAKKYVAYLSDISAERKLKELKLIMLADIKYKNFEGAFNTPKHKRGFIILVQIGALEYTFPALLNGKGIKQNPYYHKYDVLNHGLNSFYNSDAKLEVRFAALLHDIGKPIVFKQTGKMYDHDKQGSILAKKELKNLKADNKLIDSVCILIKNHMFDLQGKAKPNTIKRKIASIGYDNMKNLVMIRRADFLGSGKRCCFDMSYRWENTMGEMLEENTPQSVNDLEITGKDIIENFDIKEGKRIGIILNKLFDLTIIKPKQNDKKLLLHHAKIMIENDEV